MSDISKAMEAVSTQFGRFLANQSEYPDEINFAEREAEREAARLFPDLDPIFSSNFRIDEKKLGDLIMAASNGDAKADACLRVTAALLLEYGQHFPVPLARYAAGALCAGIPRPRRHWMKNQRRDVIIAICVKTVHLMGFSPTRNAASHGRDDCRLSACAIVSHALKEEFNVPLSEKGIEKIWSKFASVREHMPPYDANQI